MDQSDWKRLEEIIHQAGGVATGPEGIPDMVRADAMSFHTLGLALMDINDRLARLETKPDKPLVLSPYA